MLYDLFFIELYFGKVDSAQSMEELIERYGRDQVYTALALGLLDRKKMRCCEKGVLEDLCWLSVKGREKILIEA